MIFRSTVCVAALAGLLTANASMAAEIWHTSTLKWIYPLSDGQFVLIFDVSAPDCTNPNSPDKYHYVAPTQNGVTEEGSKKMYAAALAALAMDKVVQIAYDNATAACYVNRLGVLK